MIEFRFKFKFVPNNPMIGSDKDLAPNRRQAIIWTDNGLFSDAYASLDFTELRHSCILKLSDITWRLFDTEPFPGPTLILIFNAPLWIYSKKFELRYGSFHSKLQLKMSSAKCWPFCSDLDWFMLRRNSIPPPPWSKTPKRCWQTCVLRQCYECVSSTERQ